MFKIIENARDFVIAKNNVMHAIAANYPGFLNKKLFSVNQCNLLRFCNAFRLCFGYFFSVITGIMLDLTKTVRHVLVLVQGPINAGLLFV